MLSVTKRGKVQRIEGRVLGVYVRLTLGTRNKEASLRLRNEIETAAIEGPDSSSWEKLKPRLPQKTFERLAQIVGWKEKPSAPAPASWADLMQAFTAETKHRIAIGKFSHSTWKRYEHAFNAFGVFLRENGVSRLSEITRPVVEAYKAWRLERILAKRFARGGRGLALDIAVLHRIFRFANECEMVERNPVRLEGRPGDNAEAGAQPFTADHLDEMRRAAGPDRLAFLLLRHTGLRGSDATGLQWHEVDWETREINRLTQKRRKRVIIPIHTELLFELEAEREKRQPKPEERVLLNPATGRPLTRPRLYERMLALGRRAGVPNAHPHRFRDTLAVDLLAKGASPYDVAKLLGNTINTVEKHYAPFVPVLRERARRIIESDKGLEPLTKTSTDFAHKAGARERPN